MNSYLKLALKVLARRKFFTFISLFGISMTLVVLMVATAIVDNFFAPRAPESRFGRVLCVYRVTQWGPQNQMTTEPGYAFLQQYVKTLRDTERTAIFSNAQSTAIYKGTQRIDTMIKRTDADYWKILDFTFVEGRAFTAAEDASGVAVAVISDAMRDQLFGGGPAVGKTFDVEGQSFRVVGVVPKVSTTRLAAYADIWAPIGTFPTSGYRHDMMGGFNGLVLAHGTSDFLRLKREFQSSLRTFPLDRKLYLEVRTGLDTPFDAVARVITHNAAGDRGPLILYAIGAALALLFMTLPALNLVTLNLSRILERAPEIGVRKAFGAAKPALVSQFVVENVVLTLIGGGVGFVLAVVAMSALTSSNVIPNAQFDMNLRIFAYGMLISAFFGIFSGVYPAWRMARLDAVNALRGGAL